jgi:UDP-3-O-[3-hydroxymyristoyl] N-acetylglucosamine deacetylase
VIPARWDRIVDSRLCTTLGDENGIAIGTVEHLMAAFAGLEIDNATVEVDGPELPIMDGSAEAFVFLIECAGTVEQSASRKRIKVLKRVAVGDDEQASASLAPSAAPIFDFTLDYSSRAIGRQEKSLLLDRGNFKRELARARTFGFAEEVDFMRRNGLARGGSLDNAVVIDADRVLNREGLRYRDEFVRHKLLDAVGDLYLAGFPIEGAFHGQRSGHAMNARLLRALFADQTAWALVEDQPSLSAWGEPERRQASA